MFTGHASSTTANCAKISLMSVIVVLECFEQLNYPKSVHSDRKPPRTLNFHHSTIFAVQFLI